MNSSAFMDKQIMDLMSNPQSQDDLSNGGGGGTKKEEILPNYDFQPIRTFGFSEPAVNADIDAVKDSRRSWGSADSKIGSSTARYSNILEPHETAKINHENKRDTYDVATVLEVDRTVKKYADNLLHALEGVSTRLSQLESRTHHLENSVDELKTTIGNNSGSTDGKMRQLENILREVQTGVQVLRDKQEITEAQLQLAKLQQFSSKPAPEPSNATSGQPDSQHYQQPPALPGPSYQSLPSQQPPPPSYQPPPPPPPLQPPPLYQPPPPQQPPPLPTPNAPPPPQPLPPYQPPPPQQQPPSLPTPNAPSPPQNQTSPYPAQLSQSLPRDPSYFPQPQTQPPPQPQPYQLPQYSQPMVNPPQLQPMPHHLEESASCMGSPLSQTYNPNARQSAPSAQPPPPGRPPQYYGPSGFSDGYSYSGSPSHYNSSMMKPSPFSNSPPSLGGLSNNNGGNYSRLPTAKILPQAAPTSTGPSSGRGGARLPIDDVVDKVATMGFSRDQVRATVRKLTENGQSVDLNVVLDKLMNEGAEMIQPQKGWFGR